MSIRFLVDTTITDSGTSRTGVDDEVHYEDEDVDEDEDEDGYHCAYRLDQLL